MPDLVDPTSKQSTATNATQAPKLSIFNFLGWTLGAMSLLNLVQDIGRMSVFGKLKAWLDAYVLVVNNVGQVLFGWIKFYWFGVSEAEQHVLVICYLVGAAVFRAEYQHDRKQNPEVGRGLSFASVFVAIGVFWWVAPTILAVALPGYWGIGCVGIVGIGLALVWLTNNENNIKIASGRSVLRELIGVAGVFLVLVALNYSIFRTDGG